MSDKLWLILAIVCMLSMQTFGFSINRMKRSPEDDADDDKDDDDSLIPGLKLGSQQDSQSSSENLGKGKDRGMQQHNQGQQQLAAAFGKKHYILQQQTAMGQQLAKLGKKTAIQQLADVQKQAIDNGKVVKKGTVDLSDKLVSDNKDDNSDDHSESSSEAESD